MALNSGSVTAEELSFADALQQARLHAPQIVQQQANLFGATAAQRAADALPDPKAFVGVDNLPINGADRFNLTRDFMTMQKIGVMQDIPNRAKRMARAEAAQARIDEAAADLRLTESVVTRETAVAWLNRYFLGRQLSLFVDLEQENRLWAGVVQSQLTAGKGLMADALLPQQEVISLANRRDDLERDIRKADAVLERWLGRFGKFAPVGEPPAFTLNPDTLRQHVEHHPDLNRFTPLANLAQAELHEAQAAKKPDWGVELAYQQRGPGYSNMVSVQVSADLPLFTHSRQDPLIAAKQQALAEVDAEREAMLREHVAALEADLADYKALTRQRDRLQQEAAPLAQRKADLLLAAYQAGRAELGLVLTARRESQALRFQIIELTAQQQQLAARLHYLYTPDPEIAP
ncbi:outer membrane protein TolC [Fluviicoccus keumensis]|uniref:Outer membrane protein TolC n=1 Tax=Fluviicoccus keumensis TaxID=1435465 RepID=A0A4Q7ZD79_9GAMM|nr:TolC family protein [Fluviicoccus keumensis]RZU48141.1 outer membrane protein TolC [Fluviicoccus keumensis]